MPRSHLCAFCGNDLSRLPAPPDPHYGLAVVVCSTCRKACVRGRGEWVEWVRHLLRLDAWATALGVQLALAWMLLIPSGIFTFEHVISLMGDTRSAEWSIGKSLRHTLLAPALAIAGAGSGAWIAATLPHHRFLPAMATWIALMLLGHLIAVLISAGQGGWGSLFEEWHTDIGPPASSVGWMLFTLLIYAMWMLIGWPLGLLMQRGSVAIRRVRFRIRRRRARRFRRGQ